MPGSHARYQNRKYNVLAGYRNLRPLIASANLLLIHFCTNLVHFQVYQMVCEFHMHDWNCRLGVFRILRQFLWPFEFEVYSILAVSKNKIHVVCYRMCGIAIAGQAKFFNGPDAYFVPLGDGIACAPRYSYCVSHDHLSANATASRSYMNLNSRPILIHGLNPESVLAMLSVSQRTTSGP